MMKLNQLSNTNIMIHQWREKSSNYTLILLMLEMIDIQNNNYILFMDRYNSQDNFDFMALK